MYQNAEGFLQAQQCADRIACQPLCNGALECLLEAYNFDLDIVELSNKNSSKLKIPDWLTNSTLCSFFSAQEEFSCPCDFFLFPEDEIKSQPLLFDRKFMTAERLCRWTKPLVGPGVLNHCAPAW